MQNPFGTTDKVKQYSPDPAQYAYQGDTRSFYDNGVKNANATQAPQLNWGEVQDAQGLSLQDRTQQQGLVDSYNGVLSGQAPSVAQQQMQAGEAQAQARAAQVAASARGGAGAQMQAQRQAQAGAAMGALDANRDAGMLRASEQNAARQGLGSAVGMMSSADAQRVDQARQDQALSSQNILGQRQINASREQNYISGGLQSARDQGAQAMAFDAAESGNYNSAATLNTQIDEAGRDRMGKLLGGGLATGGQLGAAAIASGGE